MKIPTNQMMRFGFYKDVADSCCASMEDRRDRYAQNRYYWLHGSAPGEEPSAWNRIYPHIELVCSFLYAQESTRFSVEFGDSVPEVNFSFAEPFQKRLNNKWKDCGADNVFSQVLTKALVYDSAFLKINRRNSGIMPYVVEPGMFGVLREDQMMLDRQEAFVHCYQITLTELHARLAEHPKRNELMMNANTVGQKSSGTGPAQQQKIDLSAFMPNVLGRVNDVTGGASEAQSYQAKMSVDMADMTELWVWNDETEDWQTVTMIGTKAVVYDRQNIFLPRRTGRLACEPEHPFVQMCPSPMSDYFWGISEVSRLKELQGYRNKRMGEIQQLLAKQVDPPTSYSGMGIGEEKERAWGIAGSFLSMGPGEKLDVHAPNIPQDMWNDIHENDQAFMEASGISNIMSGRGDSGVRSKGQTTELARLGSARIKNRGLRVEAALEKVAQLAAKCLVVDDTDAMTAVVDGKRIELIPAQMSDDFSIKVDAHSNSPIFVESMKQDAEVMFKAQVITPERFVMMMNPPMKEECLRDLREKIIPAKEAQAKHEQAIEAQKAAGANGGKPPLSVAQ